MLVSRRPTFHETEAEALALEHYGLRASAHELPSERDQNFKLVTERGGYLLKVFHPDEEASVLDFQARALALLSAPHFPRLVPTLAGEISVSVRRAGREHFLRMITFLPGMPFAKRATPSHDLLHAVGYALGEMDGRLATFEHPAMDRVSQWDSRRAPQTIRNNLGHIADPDDRALIAHFLAAFERRAAPLVPTLRRSVIHNDANDYNLLVDDDVVTGIIDFGDMLRTYTVCELANACAYLMMGRPDPLGAALEVAKGYHAAYPLGEEERSVLLDFIYLRLCLSVSISARQQRQAPQDPYLSISERPAWALLETLAEASLDRMEERVKGAFAL